MSEATRAIALQEAVKTAGGSGSHANVLTAAKAYHDFMVADQKLANVSTPGAEPAAPPVKTTLQKPVPATAKLATKPAAPKPVKAVPPKQSEEEAAAALLAEADAEATAQDAAEEAAIADEAPEAATVDDVGQVISDLLAAKKRNEVVALLKKFGATSKSGVKSEDYNAFVAEGNEILNG